MPLPPGEKVRVVVLNRYGRYEAIDPVELSKLHKHYIIDIIGLPIELAERIKRSELDIPYGVPQLDADGKIKESQIRHWIKDKFKFFIQSTESTHWIIEHDFRRTPNVIILDENFYEILPHELKISVNQIDIYFLQPLKGYAILN